MKRFVVIGGGIVGLATAYRIRERWPDSQVTVLEKEDAPGRHQSGHNSGVLHAGVYYKPGSLKARLAVCGLRQMVAFCRKHAIPHEICGKLVVATGAEELSRLAELHRRGIANGLSGLAMLQPEEIREIEPHANGVGALRVPEEGIVDYAAVCAALAAEIRASGGEIVTRAEARRAHHVSGSWRIRTSAGEFEADVLINCAGLHCDRVLEAAGERRPLRIVPFRGEYYRIRPERSYLVRNLIYPVPDPAFPFLGVHFTRLIHGGIEAGPNAVLAFKREGYRKSDVSLRDMLDALAYPGLWRFLARYPRMSLAELRRSFSRRLFAEALQKLVPAIQPEDLAPGGAGVRAQAMEPDGNLVQDFRFHISRGAVHLLNAPSPGATASLAIGEEVVAKIAATL